MSHQTKDILSKITPEIRKDMETIWFSADLHHGHPKIIDICNRPVSIYLEGVEANLKNKVYREALNTAHTEWLVREVINKWVDKKHTLYLVGDVSMAKRAEAEKFLDRLNGNKFLIIGNHDKNIQNSTRFSQRTLRKDFTYNRFGLNIHIVLHHNPILSWDRKVHGAWHLYGHVHGRLKNFGHSFDIGIDNPELLDFTGGVHRPLNLFEVVEIMETKRPLDPNDLVGQLKYNEKEFE
jgi:calcineurin-like phosphoesterase family protein